MMPRIYYSDHGVVPNDRDDGLLIERVAARNKISGPRIGDFVQRLDGQLARFSYEWADGLQSSTGGSWAMNTPRLSFSGALDPAIPLAKLKEIKDVVKLGEVWFFHNNCWKAYNAVYAEIPCRVFLEMP